MPNFLNCFFYFLHVVCLWWPESWYRYMREVSKVRMPDVVSWTAGLWHFSMTLLELYGLWEIADFLIWDCCFNESLGKSTSDWISSFVSLSLSCHLSTSFKDTWILFLCLLERLYSQDRQNFINNKACCTVFQGWIPTRLECHLGLSSHHWGNISTIISENWWFCD